MGLYPESLQEVINTVKKDILSGVPSFGRTRTGMRTATLWSPTSFERISAILGSGNIDSMIVLQSGRFAASSGKRTISPGFTVEAQAANSITADSLGGKSERCAASVSASNFQVSPADSKSTTKSPSRIGQKKLRRIPRRKSSAFTRSSTDGTTIDKPGSVPRFNPNVAANCSKKVVSVTGMTGCSGRSLHPNQASG